jgi:DNA-binding CsgD family transcriptional regulator
MTHISNKLVEQLVNSCAHPAHLKDTTTDKYILSNQANDLLFRTSSITSIVGHNILDLDRYMKPNWGNMASEIIAIEAHLKSTGETYINNRYPFLSTDGLVVVQSVRKYPVLSATNKINGILSIGEAVTNNLNLFELFKFYLQFYLDNYQARLHFLKHIDIATEFYELPTEREIVILITKQIYHYPKLMANYLGIETKTVESHLYKIKSKLKIDLNNVITLLRLNHRG